MAMISVVIPTYKRNDLLERAINSVLKQTFQNFEIIIVDDNGINNVFRESNEKLRRKFVANKNVHFVFPNKNVGGSLARNVGIEHAKGKYVAFLDDDDFFYPTRLEIMLKAAENSDEKIAMFYAWTKSSNGTKYCKVYDNRFALFQLFKDDCLAATSQWMILKKALINVEGFDDTPAKQDSILTFKLLKNGYQLQCIPEILSEYNEHAGIRISSMGGALMGERNLFQRFLSVKSEFNAQQIKIIEFNFSWRFLKYNLKAKNYFNSLKYLIKIQTIDFKKSIEIVCRAIGERL